MLLVCFIIRIYHSARSSECQISLSVQVCRYFSFACSVCAALISSGKCFSLTQPIYESKSISIGTGVIIFLWVGVTAFCVRMLTDSTFVSACGKFQLHHTVYLCAVIQLEWLRHSPCARRRNSVA